MIHGPHGWRRVERFLRRARRRRADGVFNWNFKQVLKFLRITGLQVQHHKESDSPPPGAPLPSSGNDLLCETLSAINKAEDVCPPLIQAGDSSGPLKPEPEQGRNQGALYQPSQCGCRNLRQTAQSVGQDDSRSGRDGCPNDGLGLGSREGGGGFP
ncbi:unnamed protein product, partial [Discosporangium mesarthrocarpum]